MLSGLNFLLLTRDFPLTIVAPSARSPTSRAAQFAAVNPICRYMPCGEERVHNYTIYDIASQRPVLRNGLNQASPLSCLSPVSPGSRPRGLKWR